jgi:hypothetical protein
VFTDNIVGGFGTTATCCGDDLHTWTFLALNADLADRLKALGNLVIGRRLSVEHPKNQRGGNCKNLIS